MSAAYCAFVPLRALVRRLVSLRAPAQLTHQAQIPHLRVFLPNYNRSVDLQSLCAAVPKVQAAHDAIFKPAE